MKQIFITLGAGILSPRQIKSLEVCFRQHYMTHISREPVRIVWNQLSTKDIYHDYQNQPQSILFIECPEEIAQYQRVSMFEACTQDWVQVSGQRVNQLVISIIETPIYAEISQRNAEQLTVLGKLSYYLRIGLSLLRSKLRQGYFSINSSFKTT